MRTFMRSITVVPYACPSGFRDEVPARRLRRPAPDALKGMSSRRLRQEFPDLVRHYRRAQRLWPGSYCAGSLGGAPLSTGPEQDSDALHHRTEAWCTTNRLGSRGRVGGTRGTKRVDMWGRTGRHPGITYSSRRSGGVRPRPWGGEHELPNGAVMEAGPVLWVLSQDR
ncbi:transposase [Streptomyces sp. NPDC026659]|uniref:transposase n=1 Tax=Streptomyces sp. NPDC026659 TaxID=3155123 RepID=UPI0033E4D9EF